MTFEEQLAEMARYMAESQRRWDERFEQSQRRWEERHEKLQQQLHNLAATVSEDHWRFQEDLRNGEQKHKQLESLVVQIAEGTARLLNAIEAHERRFERLEGSDQP